MASRSALVLLFVLLACAECARIQQQKVAAGRNKNKQNLLHQPASSSAGKDTAETPPVEKYIQMHKAHSLSQESTENHDAMDHASRAQSQPTTAKTSAWHVSLLEQIQQVRIVEAKGHSGLIAMALGVFVLILCITYKIVGMLSGQKNGYDNTVTTTTPKKVGQKMARARTGSSSQKNPAESFGGRHQHMHDGKLVYEWAQNNEVAKVYIATPQGLVTDDLEIVIAARQLTIGRKGKPYFLNEEIYSAVDVDESAWRLCSNGELQIHMAKETHGDWPCVLLDNAASK
jgi:hypothetical protein